jgi:purine-binding chemotaxis protein CheW
MANDGESLDQWVVLCLENHEYALPVRNVVEVLRMVAVSPMPEAPPWIAGLLNLRGKGLIVMDLRRRLGLPPRGLDPGAHIVVLQTAAEPLGLVVDEVVEIIALPRQALKPAERFAGASPLLAAVAHAGERLILILDLERLGDGRAGVDSAGAGHVGT